MAGSLSLDDKLMGEKMNNYCSSSEDEGEEERGGGGALEEPPPPPAGYKKGTIQKSVNTGPKGVIEDWRRFKQLENERREESARERDEIARRLALTCKSEKEEKQMKEEDEDLMRELEELDDEFMREYRAKRLEEMKTALRNVPTFGSLTVLTSGEEMLQIIDKATEGTTVIVFVCEKDSQPCEAMHWCVIELAKDYPSTRFLEIRAKDAQLSSTFSSLGVPALLAYKGGELIGNFVRLTKDLGSDFFATDVESFLQSHSILPEVDYIGKARMKALADKD